MSSQTPSQKNNFKILKTIGGTADKVELIDFEGQNLILKIANSDNIGLYNFNELDIPVRIVHPHIVRIYSMLPRTHDSINKGFGMTMLPYDTDLGRYMAENPLSWDDRVKITYKLIFTLNLLHQERICHFDIKPENILMMGSEPAYVDFGYARSLDSTKKLLSNSLLTTYSFGPPELLDSSKIPYKYTPGVDIWSLALTILWILTENVIYPDFSFWNQRRETFIFLDNVFRHDKSRLDIFTNRFNRKYPHPTHFQRNEINQFIKILVECTQFKASKRWRLDKVLNSSVFQKFKIGLIIPPLTIIDPHRNYDLPKDFRIDLIQVVNFFVETATRVATLYLAVDLLYRSISMLNRSPEEYRYIVRKFIGAAAIWMAINTYYLYSGAPYEFLLDKLFDYYGIGRFGGDIEYFKSLIDAIMAHALGGIINPSFLFDRIPESSYKEFIESHLLKPEVYTQLDILKFPKIKTTKNPRLKDFLLNKFSL